MFCGLFSLLTPPRKDLDLRPISIIGDPSVGAPNGSAPALTSAGRSVGDAASFPAIDDSDNVVSSGEDLPPPPPPGKRQVIVAQRQHSFIDVIKVKVQF